jgi:DNA-binding transcriptional MocR family regulator
MNSNQEGRIALAIQTLHSKRCKSIRAAAKAFDVSFSSLQRRYQRTHSRRETRPNCTKLTSTEEEVLLQRILDLDEQGFPPQLAVVCNIANILFSN